MTEPGEDGYTIAKLMLLRIKLEQALAALGRRLDDEAAARYQADQASSTWRLPGELARFSTKETHDRLRVDDETAFRAYMAARFPHQYRSVHEWRPINKPWEDKLREQWAERGGYDEDGTKIPGTSLVMGGEYAGTALWASPDLKAGLFEHAWTALTEGRLDDYLKGLVDDARITRAADPAADVLAGDGNDPDRTASDDPGAPAASRPDGHGIDKLHGAPEVDTPARAA